VATAGEEAAQNTEYPSKLIKKYRQGLKALGGI